jgi:hypothetical protein
MDINKERIWEYSPLTPLLILEMGIYPTSNLYVSHKIKNHMSGFRLNGKRYRYANSAGLFTANAENFTLAEVEKAYKAGQFAEAIDFETGEPVTTAKGQPVYTLQGAVEEGADMSGIKKVSVLKGQKPADLDKVTINWIEV